MNLDEVKRQKITAWIDEGLKLSDIQSRLASELGMQLTYIEVRLLVNDLKLMPKDQPTPQPTPQLSPQQTAGQGAQPQDQDAEGAFPEDLTEAGVAPSGGTPGSVSVGVDRVARPGALVSGTVAFSDGNAAAWHLDQNGRLGIVPKQQGYRPSQQDLQSFQLELQAQLQKLGF